MNPVEREVPHTVAIKFIVGSQEHVALSIVFGSALTERRLDGLDRLEDAARWRDTLHGYRLSALPPELTIELLDEIDDGDLLPDHLKALAQSIIAHCRPELQQRIERHKAQIAEAARRDEERQRRRSADELEREQQAASRQAIRDRLGALVGVDSNTVAEALAEVVEP